MQAGKQNQNQTRTAVHCSEQISRLCKSVYSVAGYDDLANLSL